MIESTSIRRARVGGVCAHVIVAEDDAKQAEVVQLYLQRENHTVTVAADGRAALDEVRRRAPDLLVLDVMLPNVDGLDVCRIVRREHEFPVLMLTARSTEDDMLLGLDLGADDYLTKPYSPRELMARVRALLRRVRASPEQQESVSRVGTLVVDPVRHRVEIAGNTVDCTPGEFTLLEVLASQPDRVFTREQLLELASGFDRYVTGRTVDVHVLNLRKKLERDPSRPAFLKTVFGVGYKLTDGDTGAKEG